MLHAKAHLYSAKPSLAAATCLCSRRTVLKKYASTSLETNAATSKMEAGTRSDRTERAKNSANASSYRVYLRGRGANGGRRNGRGGGVRRTVRRRPIPAVRRHGRAVARAVGRHGGRHGHRVRRRRHRHRRHRHRHRRHRHRRRHRRDRVRDRDVAIHHDLTRDRARNRNRNLHKCSN